MSSSSSHSPWSSQYSACFMAAFSSPAKRRMASNRSCFGTTAVSVPDSRQARNARRSVGVISPAIPRRMARSSFADRVARRSSRACRNARTDIGSCVRDMLATVSVAAPAISIALSTRYHRLRVLAARFLAARARFAQLQGMASA